MSHRVSKKLVPALSDIDGAVILVNALDPQIATVKLFEDAVSDLPYFVIINKVDLATVTRVQEIVEKFQAPIVKTSIIKHRGLHGVIDAFDKLPEGKIAVLGIFNSGKTSLINELTGSAYEVGDIPGTTLEITPTSFGKHILVDTVGQVVDVNKPLMVSIDLSAYPSKEAKLRRCLEEDINGIKASLESAMLTLPMAVDLIIKQVNKGKKIIVTGAGASALVAMEIAGQGQETGLPIMVFTNNFSQAQPIGFAKGFAEDELSLAEYGALAVNEGDIAIGISASGGTASVHELLFLAQMKKAYTIAITENSDTPLGKSANIIIKSEAKPEGPSSSKIQIAHLAIGHALILTIADIRGIDAQTSINYMLPKKAPNKRMGIK